ncbi:MAG: type II toxin-antitoxin system VapC family toxin [Candidatus Portnoybacteria bacterium]|nr:type II toxin-antitoxin system VapC family toxin [Candidatus Portnoybacteria bacterium]
MTIDANIVIAYLGGELSVISTLTKWREEGRSLFLSTVAETEVLSFSEWTIEERHATEVFLEENFLSLSFNRVLARIAASIRSKVRIKFPDAAIAATALYTSTPLVTRDVQDFKRIAGLEIINI